MSRQRTSDRTRRRFGGGTRCLTLLLCAATWRGPLPCLHIHGSDAGAAATSEMVRHLRAYHTEPDAEAVAHWHIHLLLPWHIFHSDETPGDRHAPVDPLLAQQTIVERAGPDSCSVAALFTLQLWGWCFDAPAFTGPAPETMLSDAHGQAGDPCDSFLTTMLRAAPLCAVTGVALR